MTEKKDEDELASDPSDAMPGDTGATESDEATEDAGTSELDDERLLLESINAQIAEKSERWTSALAATRQRIDALVDPPRRIVVLGSSAQVYIQRSPDESETLKAYEPVVGSAPIEPKLITSTEMLLPERDREKLAEKFIENILGGAALVAPSERLQLFKHAARIASAYVRKPELRLELWRRVQELEPNNVAALEQLAGFYASAGQWAELVTILERQSELAEDASEKLSLLQKLAYAARKVGDDAKAASALQGILRLSPGDRHAQESTPEERPVLTQAPKTGRRPMQKTHFKTSPKASTSLWSLAERKRLQQRPMAAARSMGFAGTDATAIHESDRVSVILELDDPSQAAVVRPANLRPDEHMDPLDPDGRFWSAQVSVDRVRGLWSHPAVARVETKKRDELMLDKVGAEIGVLAPAGGQAVAEDGTGVLVGIVDSGFDLTHPMFRDAAGALRVAGLLDQITGQEPTAAQLAAAVAGGAGSDGNGHGTHVASIAAGSLFGGLRGIAPGAQLLLVKTDFINTDRAVKWIFDKATALGKPCVVNLSLGNHFGAHDGTDAKERLYARLTRDPGRIVVVSAGNERGDRVHVGGRFSAGQTEDVTFDVLPRNSGAPFVTITAWYDERDVFEGGLVTPSGQVLAWPDIDSTDTFGGTAVQLEVARARHPMGRAVKIQVTLEFDPALVRSRDLRGWGLRFICQQAVVGRLDAWANNSGFAIFRDHTMLEDNRIVGIPGTGDGTITVASYVTKSQWTSDSGAQTDSRVVPGRISPFSSIGPTRDGREKPDIAAPGQYVTAALATASDMAQTDDRAETAARLLTIEGTSMAAPVVTGAVALLLQKKPTLTLAQVRDAFMRGARRDAHTGAMRWDPAYGYGKLGIAATLALV